LTYILAIAETESLSAAAKQLEISQPALSKYLSELESEMGRELFLRYKKKLYPTPAGQLCIDAARRVISVKDQTYQTIRYITGQNNYTTLIKIGVTPFRGAMKIAEIIPAFQRRYPHTEISIVERYPADLRTLVTESLVNMALCACMDLEDPEVDILSGNEEELLLFVPSFHPLAHLASADMNHLTKIDIREFQDTPFLLSQEGSTFYKVAESLFRQNNMNPTIVYKANNNLMLRNMVQSGAGVCLLPRSQIIPSSRIVYFSLKPSYYTHLAVMFPKNKVLSEEERYIIALIYATEYKNQNYRSRPTPAAREIMSEFNFEDLRKELMLE
jgi:DNA-binding transcriptional LysR family regulator